MRYCIAIVLPSVVLFHCSRLYIFNSYAKKFRVFIVRLVKLLYIDLMISNNCMKSMFVSLGLHVLDINIYISL
jgi:hypothetical protein